MLLAATFSAPARALPPPSSPTAAAAAATPTPHPSAFAYLPTGSPIEFVLDQRVDSKGTQPGSSIPIHLAKPLVVGGIELAAAGTKGTLKVVSTNPALAPDVDGSIRIEIDPLTLPGRGSLPVTPLHEFVNIDRTAGHDSTGTLADEAVEVFVPLYSIAKVFRKGRELTLPRGSIVRARTDASIDASSVQHVIIATPAPYQLETDVPHAVFTPIPLYTASPSMLNPPRHSRAKPTPTPEATATPTVAPSPAPTAT
jgi:hypothetical protein